MYDCLRDLNELVPCLATVKEARPPPVKGSAGGAGRRWWVAWSSCDLLRPPRALAAAVRRALPKAKAAERRSTWEKTAGVANASERMLAACNLITYYVNASYHGLGGRLRGTHMTVNTNWMSSIRSLK